MIRGEKILIHRVLGVGGRRKKPKVGSKIILKDVVMKDMNERELDVRFGE